jgi:hypothetical protein
MSRKRVSYTQSEELLAQLMFEKAKAAGTLKPGRGIAVLITSSRLRRSLSQATSHLDYRQDARQLLSREGAGNKRRQWTREELERLLVEDERRPGS